MSGFLNAEAGVGAIASGCLVWVANIASVSSEDETDEELEDERDGSISPLGDPIFWNSDAGTIFLRGTAFVCRRPEGCSNLESPVATMSGTF
jgi:hypothetical protein